jgi:pimeloyl-ACP methyl ester carboxylesterase
MGMSNTYTLEAAKKFGSFTKPVLVAWATEDRLFSTNIANRLHKAFPNSKLAWISDSLTLIPEDQPKVLADQIRSFLQTNKKSNL